MAELDGRLYQIIRDVTSFRSLTMAPRAGRLAPGLSQCDLLRLHDPRPLTAGEAYYPLTSGRKRRPAAAEAFAQIAGTPFVIDPASRPAAATSAGRNR